MVKDNILICTEQIGHIIDVRNGELCAADVLFSGPSLVTHLGYKNLTYNRPLLCNVIYCPFLQVLTEGVSSKLLLIRANI